MMDSRIRDRLFEHPDIAKADAALREAVRKAAGCTQTGATYLLRDHYRELAEPRHAVTRWS